MARQTINSGSAPIVWSTVTDAFEKINANFTEIYSTLGGEIDSTDFTGLETSVIPNQNDQYTLGSFNNRWQQLFLTSQGVLIGNAALRAEGTVLQLPSGSKVGDKLINDPADVGFGIVRVQGQDDVVANTVTDILTLAAGAGITLTTGVEVGTDLSITPENITTSITISNTGVLDVVSGTGITVSGNETKTITNTGVTAVSAGLGVSVDNSTGPVVVTNEGIVGLEAGTGITIGARSAETGRIVITNSAPSTGILVFRDIVIEGQPLLTAQSVADQLSFVAGNGIALTTAPAGGGFSSRVIVSNNGVTSIDTTGSGIVADNSSGTVTLSFDSRVDIVGSVFADDSSLMVDGINGRIVGPIESTDSGNTISMTASGGIVIGSTNAVSIIGDEVFVGSGPNGGTSGAVVIGNGSNTVTFTVGTVVNVTNVDLTSLQNAIVDWVGIVGTAISSSGLPVLPTQTLDIKGSVFADDSSVLVDAVNGIIPGYISIQQLTSLTAAATTYDDFKTAIALL